MQWQTHGIDLHFTLQRISKLTSPSEKSSIPTLNLKIILTLCRGNDLPQEKFTYLRRFATTKRVYSRRYHLLGNRMRGQRSQKKIKIFRRIGTYDGFMTRHFMFNVVTSAVVEFENLYIYCYFLRIFLAKEIHPSASFSLFVSISPFHECHLNISHFVWFFLKSVHFITIICTSPCFFFQSFLLADCISETKICLP